MEFELKKKIILPDGNTFIGEIDENGLRNGIGIKIYQNGATFEGTWINDIRHGVGVKTWVDGNVKLVEYENGKLLKYI